MRTDSSSDAGADASMLPGASVPTALRLRSSRSPTLLSPAAQKAIRQRMLLFRSSALTRISALTGVAPDQIKRYRRELMESDLPELLLQRGAGLPFTREFPQGALLYLLVRAQRPRRVVETGVRPGYSTTWLLAALEANASGELISLGPGSAQGRVAGVHQAGVGQFVPPALRGRWTLVLGNSEERLQQLLNGNAGIDTFLYDNGPNVLRARFELRSAWAALSERGILLAHHIEANAAWSEFCHAQGVPDQVFDPGPPPMGALAMQAPRR
jgi:predicted O-methyltransferase YrrM